MGKIKQTRTTKTRYRKSKTTKTKNIARNNLDF